MRRFKAMLFRRIMSWFSLDIIEDAIYRVVFVDGDEYRKQEMLRFLLRFYGRIKKEKTGRRDRRSCYNHSGEK